MQIDKFIKRLSLVSTSKESTNLYSGNSRESLIRSYNLNAYLTKMETLNPRCLVLGEAPGYKGCRLTGIPFTSEKVMGQDPFFQNMKMRFINENDVLESEISATIIWNEISRIESKPLIWNIFPFHPHFIDEIYKNRTPTNDELKAGKVILNELLEIFKIQKIIALGRKPESQLSDLGISYSYVRHPANGGKNKFVEGFHTELMFN